MWFIGNLQARAGGRGRRVTSCLVWRFFRAAPVDAGRGSKSMPWKTHGQRQRKGLLVVTLAVTASVGILDFTRFLFDAGRDNGRAATVAVTLAVGPRWPRPRPASYAARHGRSACG